jgi:hypothetical protein
MALVMKGRYVMAERNTGVATPTEIKTILSSH